jgi:hypothetical protein
MDKLGSILWDEFIKAARKRDVHDNFKEFACDQVLALTPKTLWRRLNDDGLWLMRELEQLQDFCQSEIVEQAISERFRLKVKKSK